MLIFCSITCFDTTEAQDGCTVNKKKEEAGFDISILMLKTQLLPSK